MLADRKIRHLLGQIAGITGIFLLILVLLAVLKCPALCMAAVSAVMAAAILAAVYRYFREQEKILENAAEKIREYLSGNHEARIPCDDEGSLCRLFHEVNSLAAVLNAHAENEGSAKRFLKNTLSDISHQFKTPLAALNIYNGLLLEEAADLPEIREFAALSEQELDRIETLVQNLLKITKLDSGTLVMEKAIENVSEMMEAIEKHFAFQADREGKNLSFSGDDTAVLFCDRSWIIEAISNLVQNAFDHTREGDSIQLRWQALPLAVRIVVKDTGRGIHPEDLYYIFKRFYRSRFSKDTRGIGLGLPLAKAIVEAHSGAIEVDSTLGAGTAFTITFPESGIPTKL